MNRRYFNQDIFDQNILFKIYFHERIQKIENRLEKTIIIRSTKAVEGIHANYFHRILVCPICYIGIPGMGKVIFLETFKRILDVFMNIKQHRNWCAITTKYGKYKIAAV